MVLFSVLFVVIAAVLTPWLGSVGFILANAINMLVRAIKRYAIHKYVDDLSITSPPPSGHFIYEYVHHHPQVAKDGHPLQRFWPNGATLATMVAALAITLASESRFVAEVAKASLQDIVVHVGVGAGCLAVLGGNVLATVRD